MIDSSTPKAVPVNSRVSVVIPTHNHLHRLQGTLRRALDQRGVEIEVVVVDDGSDDGTSRYLDDLVRTDARVQVVRHDGPRGVARARNSGIEAARGELIAFLDDDDLWSPNKLRRQLDAMQLAEAPWAYSAAVFVDAGANPLQQVDSPETAQILPALLVEQVIPAGASNVIVRTDLVRCVGGFDEAFAHLADWDLWIRLAEAAVPARCEEVLVAYVEHDMAMHMAPDIDRAHGELAYLEQKHRLSRESYGLTLDSPAISRWIAEGHRQAGRRWPEFKVHLCAAFRHREPRALVRALRTTLPQRPLRPWRTPLAPQAPQWLRDD